MHRINLLFLATVESALVVFRLLLHLPLFFRKLLILRVGMDIACSCIGACFRRFGWKWNDTDLMVGGKLVPRLNHGFPCSLDLLERRFESLMFLLRCFLSRFFDFSLLLFGPSFFFWGHLGVVHGGVLFRVLLICSLNGRLIGLFFHLSFNLHVGWLASRAQPTPRRDFGVTFGSRRGDRTIRVCDSTFVDALLFLLLLLLDNIV